MKKSMLFLFLLYLLSLPAAASQSSYCFSPQDFKPQSQGICLKEIPSQGLLRLGSRILRPGDVLTAQQAAEMVFEGGEGEASLTYYPIAQGHMDPAALTVFSFHGKNNQPPVAQDSTLETYKNLPNSASLRVTEPEGEEMTFTLVRKPRRGTVAISPDGSFTYTPKNNKVGVDSFTYRAVDAQGAQSRVATVTVTILKPTEVPQYQDAMSPSQRFAAEWMKNTGIFTGETLDGQPCFQPEKPVSRGEFLAMLIKALDIPPEEGLEVSGYENLPFWLRPYLGAALRAGLTADLPDFQNLSLPISAGEAALLKENALEQGIPAMVGEAVEAQGQASLLTRGEAGELLYEIYRQKFGK